MARMHCIAHWRPWAAQARSPAEATGSEKPACYVARWVAWPACVAAPAAHQPTCGICGRGQHDVIKRGNSSDGWELLQDYTNGEVKQLHKTVWRSYGRDRWITEAFQSESSSTSNMSDTINANDRFFCRRLYIVASVPSTQTKQRNYGLTRVIWYFSWGTDTRMHVLI